MSQYDAWIGRTESRSEYAAREPVRRLSAMLDRDDESASGVLPPMGHWLYFLPDAPQALIGSDGHPARGGFLPPIPLPMRMWAGSRIDFLASIPLDRNISRRSTLVSISEKNGRTGPLAFLTIKHDTMSGDTLCISEHLDLVFRDRSPSAAAPADGERREAAIARSIDPTAALLFRYSALTYNAHRIHYDRTYAMEVEGYPGLVVHGPLLATLLVDHVRGEFPNASLKRIAFRARRPVYDVAPFTVNLVATGTGADVWASDADGYVAMDATAEFTQ
jgi:3-methylfumaryl-CoA hydratase